MADIEVFGIGLDTSSAVRNAKNLEKALLDVSKSSGKVTKSGESMASAMLKSQIAFAALSKAANFLTDQLKQSVTVGAGFEQQMAKVVAISVKSTQSLEAQAEQSKALSAAAKEMGKTTQFSATEAATALEAMGRAGFKAQQSIAALPKVLQLSAASGVSLGESADIVTNVMSSMGKQVSDLSHVNNVLVETFTSSNTTLESLASSISYAGGIAATTGVSFEQLNGFLGIFGNAGVSGTRAGTALRQAMATLIDPTKKAADTLKSLNVEVGQNLVETLRDLENAGASSKDMIAIFGTEAGGALLTLQQSGGIAAVEEMAHQLKNVGDVADEIAKKQMDTLQGSFTKLSSAIEGIRISIFEDLIRDDLKIFIDGLTESIQANEQSFRAVVNISKVVLENLLSLGKATLGLSENTEDLTSNAEHLVDALKFVSKVVTTITTGFEVLGQTIGNAASVAVDLFEALKVANLHDYFFGTEQEVKKFGDTFNQVYAGVNDLVEENKQKLDSLVKTHQRLDKAAKIQEQTTKDQTQATDLHSRQVEEQAQATDKQSRKTEELRDETEKVTEAIKKVTQAQQQQEIATGRTTQAIERQAKTQVQAIQVQAEAAATAERASRFPAGSSFGSDWSDYVKSQGFSIVTQAARPRETQPTQQPMSFGGFGGGVQQSTRASANLGNLLTRYERLSEQITDFITKDVSLDIKLADAQQELRNLSVELASLNEGQLEERIKLSEQYFAQVQAVDRLQTQVAAQQKASLSQQQSSAEGIGGILDSVLADLDALTVGDISGAIPVEKFDLLKKQFEATSAAIDNIDFSEITKADQELIAQFSNVSKTFLEQAQTVFGNDANYQSMQDDVKKEFEDLASNLVIAMGDADPTVFQENLNKLKTSFAALDTTTKTLTTDTKSLDSSFSGEDSLNTSILGLTTSSDSATSALSGDGKLNNSIDGLGTASTTTTTKTGSFAETLASLETQLDQNSTATSVVNSNTSELSRELKDTSAPFEQATTNLSDLSTNITQVTNFIAEQFIALQKSIEAGDPTAGTVTPPDFVQTPGFSGYEVGTNFLGNFDVFKTMSDGTKERIQGNITLDDIVVNSANTKVWYGIKNTKTGKFERNMLSTFGQDFQSTVIGIGSKSPPDPSSFAKGAWNINGSVQPAMLHRGEMVIRQDDAPAVRSYLSSTGASSKYGAPMSEAPSYDTARTIELLSLILEQLRDQRDPTVYLNARKVSEELQRYRGLSA